MTNTIKEALTEFKTSRFGLFRGFVVAVLVQFSLLSCAGISSTCSLEVLPVLSTLANSADYWWCFISLFGALVLTFEHTFRKCLAFVYFGYASAIVSLLVLGLDFILREPPVYTAASLTITVAIFFGGLVYDRIKGRTT